MKLCRGCLLEKDPAMFGVCRRAPDGKSWRCKACLAILRKKQYWADPEKFKKAAKDWREVDALRTAASRRKSYLATMAKTKEISKAWRARNPAKVSATRRKRESTKIKRTPAWLTPQDLKDIELFYLMARALTVITGEAHHVDHELPLRGKYVSGLHVAGNLQILTASENCAKRNHWTPE